MTNGLTISKTIFNLLDKKSLIGQYQGGCSPNFDSPNDREVQFGWCKCLCSPNSDSLNHLLFKLGYYKCLCSPNDDSPNVNSPLGYSRKSTTVEGPIVRLFEFITIIIP